MPSDPTFIVNPRDDFPGVDANSILLQNTQLGMSSSGLYDLTYSGFGVMNFTSNGAPTTGYFTQLSGSNTQAMIAYNYPGLGLPSNIYETFIDLLVDRVSKPIRNQITCHSTPGGVCKLINSCDYYDTLWKFSFKLQFGSSANYLNVPISAFAMDLSNGKCELWIS